MTNLKSFANRQFYGGEIKWLREKLASVNKEKKKLQETKNDYLVTTKHTFLFFTWEVVTVNQEALENNFLAVRERYIFLDEDWDDPNKYYVSSVFSINYSCLVRLVNLTSSSKNVFLDEELCYYLVNKTPFNT